jgi:hypothetical protein
MKLDDLSGGLEASPRACKFFVEVKEEKYRIF